MHVLFDEWIHVLMKETHSLGKIWKPWRGDTPIGVLNQFSKLVFFALHYFGNHSELLLINQSSNTYYWLQIYT